MKGVYIIFACDNDCTKWLEAEAAARPECEGEFWAHSLNIKTDTVTDCEIAVSTLVTLLRIQLSRLTGFTTAEMRETFMKRNNYLKAAP